MGFLKSLRDRVSSEKLPTNTQSQQYQDSQPHSSLQTGEEYKTKSSHESSTQYEPPPGPPPSRLNQEHKSEYEPPEGPPPSSLKLSSTTHQPEYLPPAGPPPSSLSSKTPGLQLDTEYDPPPGPPPGHSQSQIPFHPKPQSQEQDPKYQPPELPPPTYETWLSHPYNDNASLPPPPSLPQEFSPTNNASSTSADLGAQFCQRYHLTPSAVPSEQVYNTARDRQRITMERPPANTFRGDLLIQRLDNSSADRSGKTYDCRIRFTPPPRRRNRQTQPQEDQDNDVSIMTTLPIYFARLDNPTLCPDPHPFQSVPKSPLQGETLFRSSHPNTKTIFFSVKIVSLPSTPTSGVAIGFCARPYPPFRLPGWHRGSLAVHSDDGRRYVNDPYGGREFVRPFRPGDEIGLGITFRFDSGGPQADRAEGFLVRNGREVGRWDLREERDAEFSGGEGLVGLLGEGDLYPVVGLFGDVEVWVKF